jgi:hypothetical protein
MLRRPKGQSAKLSLGVSGKAALKASNPWSRGCNPAPDSHNSRQSELDKVCIRPEARKSYQFPPATKVRKAAVSFSNCRASAVLASAG